jgi:two-component system sensor kinase FixL
MSDTPKMLQRLDHLAEDELQRRLQHEQAYLESASPSEQLFLLHELRVYQIELEIQNRELRDMRAEIEAARDRYASLYDSAPISYLSLDEHGVIEQVNLTATRLFGREPQALIGLPFISLMEGGNTGRFFDYLERVHGAGGEPVSAELRLKTVKGEAIDAALKSILIQHKGSGKWECRTAVIDLTRQRRAEAEARANRDALAHAARLNKMGEMASGVMHELSQPMAAVITYSGILNNLLKQDADRRDLIRITEKISAQAERSVTLLKHLRDFAGSRPLDKSFNSVAQLIDDALGLLGTKLRHSGIRVVICADASLPEVYVDPIQLSQVLINLISNAVDSLRKNNIRGKVVISVHREGPDRLRVTVRDNGPGIDPTIADRLFMPFKTTKESGLGLGLSLSRSIIEAHGGRLGFEQMPEQGAHFFFTLPTQENENDE